MSFAGLLCLVSVDAAAQESSFANQGYLTLSAERLVGLSFTNDTEKSAISDAEVNQKLTLFGFGPNLAVLNPFEAPQLGIDHFVIDGLSLGAAFSLWSFSGESETTAPNTSTTTNTFNDITVFRMTPRVGYGVMFTDILGFWGRGGLTYYSLSSEQDDGDTDWEHGWAVTLDAFLMISPLDHFAIHLGPTADIGFTGEEEFDPAEPNLPTTSTDIIRRQYGLHAGITGWF